ncbi:MAG TPA: IPT/TIG domain-containing protein, partial [Thermoanaerobaculia bacterium]
GVAEANLAVADANAPFTISPNVAWTTGGDVTITGLTLPACSVGTCAAPLVTFGGSEAQIEEFGPPDKLVVYAEAHDAGTVDVVVRYGGQTYTATAAFNYFVPTSFVPTGVTDPAFFEPVLFPVIITGPGAFGSNWTTEVTMRNENDYPLPVTSVFDQGCFPPCDARPTAHSTAIVRSANAPNGLLLNIPRQSSPKLFFGTLIRDLSRQSEALGTEIPVVREDDFFDRPFTLLNVPTDSRYRVAMRLYRIDGGVTLHYRIRPLSTDETLVDAFAFLAPESQGSTLTFAFIGDLLTTYPQLAGKGPLRIDIDGTPAQRASWAFVSVTNNTTQNVTVISPQ